tara:strand:+ start:3761 stop:4921 length:1161 start_codon:yes stop_codon:yes gene_type:complete
MKFFRLIHSKKKYFLSVLAISFIAINLSFNSGFIAAQQPTPVPTPTPIPVSSLPPFSIKEAIGFNNIASATAGDYLILVRYDLEIGEGANEFWCKEEFLINDSGCSLTPSNPDYAFSLREGFVFIEYLDSAGTIHRQNRKIPRIDAGLVGIYAESPASSEFGFNTALLPGKVCLRYADDFFDPSGNGSWNCKQVSNISGGTTALANEISSDSGILYNLEAQIGLPLNTLTSSRGKVTPTGQVYLEEALQGIVDVAVDSSGNTVFQLGSTLVNKGYTPSGSNIPLQESLNATATASGVTNNLKNVSSEYLGFDSPMFFGGLLFIILSLFVASIVIATTKNVILAVLSASMMMLPGIFIGAVSIAFIFTALSLFIVIGSWYWLRRSPE